MRSLRWETAVVVVLVVTSALARPPLVSAGCDPDGTFGLPGGTTLLGPVPAGTVDAVVVDGRRVSIRSGCPASALRDARIGVKRTYVRVIAIWKSCGGARQVRLDGRIVSRCSVLGGRLVIRNAGAKPVTTLVHATKGLCGDGAVEPPAEECEPSSASGCNVGQVCVDCRCLSATTTITTTSTSTSSSTTVTTTTETSSSSSSATASSTSTSSSSTSSTTTTSSPSVTTSSSSSTTTRTSVTTSTSSSTTTTTTSSSTSSSSSSSTSSSSTSSSASVPTVPTTSTTTTTCPSRLTFFTSTGTTSCGGAGFSPPPAALADHSTPPEAPGFSGAIFSDTAGTTKVANLGVSCLYVGGGGNTATPPNANPDGSFEHYGIASCPGGSLVNLQGHPGLGAVAGNGNGWGGHALGVDCSLAPYATRHCTRTGAVCATSDDCAAGSHGLCNPDPRCIFGPPLPVPSATSTCVLNVVRADASGTVDTKTGGSAISVPLASYIYLTQQNDKFCRNGADGKAGPASGVPIGKCLGDADCSDLPGSAGACVTETPCPTCIDYGTGVNHCVSGQNHGKACAPVGSKATTADCLPSNNNGAQLFLGPLFVDLAPLGTGTQTLAAVQNPARSGQFFFCPAGGGAATCPDPGSAPPLGETCQQQQGAFGKPTAKLIRETGVAAGDLTDGQEHPATISTVFCVPATGNGLVDGGTGVNLPGPGAVSIRGTFRLVP